MAPGGEAAVAGLTMVAGEGTSKVSLERSEGNLGTPL